MQTLQVDSVKYSFDDKFDMLFTNQQHTGHFMFFTEKNTKSVSIFYKDNGEFSITICTTVEEPNRQVTTKEYFDRIFVTNDGLIIIGGIYNLNLSKVSSLTKKIFINLVSELQAANKELCLAKKNQHP